MKRLLILIAAASMLTCVAVAQAPAANDTSKPGAAPQQSQPAQSTKPGEQPAQATPPAPPSGGTKTAPTPKTKEEQEAMQAVIAKQNDPAAMQAAVDDFASKFPGSGVTGMLYRQVMLVYDQSGNSDKAYEAGRKALTYDADDPLTLANVAMYLAAHTHDSDLDKAERLADVRKYANAALTNLDQLRMSAQADPAQMNGIKKYIQGQAYDALASAAQTEKNWPEAEANYAKSIDASPDPATLVRLGFAQRMQGKLEAAQATFTRALDEATKANASTVAQFAQQQKASVEKELAKRKQSGATATPAATPAPATTPKQ